MKNKQNQFFICGEIVELRPETKEKFKEMKNVNRKLRIDCSFKKGMVMRITDNENEEFPRIITVDHGGGKIYNYLENDLIRSRETVEISYKGDVPYVSNTGNKDVLIYIPENILHTEINGHKHVIRFNPDGSVSFLDNSGKEYVKIQ